MFFYVFFTSCHGQILIFWIDQNRIIIIIVERFILDQIDHIYVHTTIALKATKILR